MSEPLAFSQACENNKNPILEVIRPYLSGADSVLELAGGTGQHAEHFARNLPHLIWQSSDLEENISALNRRIELAQLANLPRAYTLDVTGKTWPCGAARNIFTANCLHIMSAASVQLCFEGIGKYLAPGGLLFIYGPFKYKGEFTTQSNAQFDLWLKSRNPLSGVRDIETILEFAAKERLIILEDNDMPANNQLLVFSKGDGD